MLLLVPKKPSSLILWHSSSLNSLTTVNINNFCQCHDVSVREEEARGSSNVERVTSSVQCTDGTGSTLKV